MVIHFKKGNLHAQPHFMCFILQAEPNLRNHTNSVPILQAESIHLPYVQRSFSEVYLSLVSTTSTSQSMR